MSDADRSVIGGRYQVIASLGKGGMGLVYKAYDPVLDRTVALKKMIATVVDSEEGRQRFYIEARAAARLNHPNIVTIHELEEYSGDIYIVMELLDGVSLASFMRERVHLPLAGYLTIIAQIADGLHYAHKRAIVHRDVKPANLVLITTGNLKILDFGIARLASNEITRKGKLLGTPHYMAPEQVQEQTVDARADLFSLGAVAYELVTGIKPFAADSIAALLMQITSTPHRPVLEVAPETEPALAAIIDRLLAKERSERFLTGMEVIAALDLIGEIDRTDLVAEAVAAVMGPSGEMTIYAPIGATPQPASATPPPAEDVTQSLSAPASAPVAVPVPAPVPVPVTAAEASAAPVLNAWVSADAPTLVDVEASAATPPDVPPRNVTLDTMVGAPPPLPAAAEAAANPPPVPPVPARAQASGPGPGPVPAPVPPPAVPPSPPARAATPPPPSVPLPAAAPAATTPTASAPRGFVNPGVPQPRHRSGVGAAVVVVGLLLLPAVVAVGWWAARGALQKETTTATDTTSPSTVKDVDPATQKPADPPVATTDPVKPGETPGGAPGTSAETASQQPAQNPPPADADATTATVKPPDGAEPARTTDASPTADANRATASQVADASRTAQPNQTPGSNQPIANQANANQPNARPANANQGDANRANIETRDARNVAPPARDLTREPGREPARDAVTDRTREVAADTVVRDATRESSRTPDREATRENARVTPTPREPAPPVREQPAPAEPPREPSTPADTRTLDYSSLSAFRGGSKSTGSASNVYSDSPSTAAAMARIAYALEAYGEAIAARDLDALRDVRSPVTPAEATMLKEGRLTVRFSNLDVNIDGNAARVRCQRAVVANGKTVSSGPSDVRLTRRPEGWVITEIR